MELVQIETINGKRFFNGIEIIENPSSVDDRGFVGDVAYFWSPDGRWVVDEMKTELSFNVNELEKTYKKPESDGVLENILLELGIEI